MFDLAFLAKKNHKKEMGKKGTKKKNRCVIWLICCLFQRRPFGRRGERE